jgi:hypothetical protein
METKQEVELDTLTEPSGNPLKFKSGKLIPENHESLTGQARHNTNANSNRI